MGLAAHQGRAVRKPVNANPGVNVNRSPVVIFSRTKTFLTTCVLCSLRLFKVKTKEQTI